MSTVKSFDLGMGSSRMGFVWAVRPHWLGQGRKHTEVHSQFISVVDEQMNSFFGDHVCMLICSHRQSDRKGVLSFVEEKY